MIKKFLPYKTEIAKKEAKKKKEQELNKIRHAEYEQARERYNAVNHCENCSLFCANDFNSSKGHCSYYSYDSRHPYEEYKVHASDTACSHFIKYH